MFYGAIKDALMIRYEYSAEWQLISRQRALTATSSMANLAYMTGYSHYLKAIFTCWPLEFFFFFFFNLKRGNQNKIIYLYVRNCDIYNMLDIFSFFCLFESNSGIMVFTAPRSISCFWVTSEGVPGRRPQGIFSICSDYA